MKIVISSEGSEKLIRLESFYSKFKMADLNQKRAKIIELFALQLF